MVALTMKHFYVRRVLVVLAVLALVAVSTAAVAHGHLDTNCAHESHCPLCMALHNAKHALVTPIATLCFTTVQAARLVPSKDVAVVFAEPLLTQGRAPPQL
jgi:hypothetical protein